MPLRPFLSYLCIWEILFLIMSFCCLFPQTGTGNALYFPQAGAFVGWCTQVSHYLSKCSYVPASACSGQFFQVGTNAAKKTKRVWKQEEMPHIASQDFVQKDTTLRSKKSQGFLQPGRNFSASLPFLLWTARQILGCRRRMPCAGFPADCLGLRMMPQIFDVQASLESSFLVFFIALAKRLYLAMLN